MFLAKLYAKKGSVNMMRILIDTNVVIDYLADRQPFADPAGEILFLCESGQILGMVTANAITDVYYVVRKEIDRDRALDAIQTLCSVFDIVDIGKTDILGAIELGLRDFEDSLVAQCAKKSKADYIITRNLTDFVVSPVSAQDPQSFVKLIKAE